MHDEWRLRSLSHGSVYKGMDQHVLDRKHIIFTFKISGCREMQCATNFLHVWRVCQSLSDFLPPKGATLSRRPPIEWTWRTSPPKKGVESEATEFPNFVMLQSRAGSCQHVVWGILLHSPQSKCCLCHTTAFASSMNAIYWRAGFLELYKVNRATCQVNSPCLMILLASCMPASLRRT